MLGEKHTEQSCKLFMHILASAAIKPQNPKGKNKSIYYCKENDIYSEARTFA